MKVIGVTGRIGSGKSTLCRMLADRHGCPVIDADALGHAALRDPSVRARVVRRFGEWILGPDGEVDRGLLARAVFADSMALSELEAMTHPWIIARISERLVSLQVADPTGIVLVDAAMLLPWIGRLPIDEVVWVRASEDASLGRLGARGIGESEGRARLSRQSPEDAFRERADRVIDNSGSLEDLALEAERLWDALTEIR